MKTLVLTKEAPEVIIVGGGEIYRAFLPLVSCIHITYVKTQLAGETTFVALNHNEWQEVSREEHFQDDKHAFDYSFVTLLKA